MPQEIIGRRAELAAIEDTLDRAMDRLAGIVICGDPGIGKTTLWEAARAAGAESGFHVLSARPTSSESGLPLAGFGDLFADVGPDVLRRLPDPQRHAVEVALLRTEPAGAPSNPRLISVAGVSLLRALTVDHGPILIAIDDLQWLDESSAGVLRFAIRRVRDLPLAVAVTTLGSTASADTLDLRHATALGDLEDIALAPLSLAALHRLLVAHLGRSFPRLALVRIEAVAAGNPFYTLEMARALLRTGQVVTPRDPLPIPETIEALTGARIAALPGRTRDLLLIAAVAGETTLDTLDGVSPGHLRGAAGVATALEAAEREGIVAIDTGTVRFVHPLFLAAVLSAVDPVRIRAVHAALAASVESPEARARHIALGTDGPDEQIARSLAVTALQARARGAPLVGADLLELARGLTPIERADEAASRTYDAAQCYFEAGELERASRLLEELVATLVPGSRRAMALQLLGQLRARFANFEEALDLAKRALAEAGDDPATKAGIELDVAFSTFCLGDIGGALPILGLAIAHAAAAGIDALEAEALACLSIAEFLAGLGIDEARMARALALEDPLRSAPLEMRPRFVQALLELFTGRLDEALARLGEMRAEAAERGQETSVPFLDLYLVVGLLWRGDRQTALRVVEETREIAAINGGAIARALALTASALVDARNGLAERVRADAGEALTLFQESRFTFYMTWPMWALGLVELSLGDVATTDAILRPLAEGLVANGAGDPILGVVLPEEVEALVALGELDRAERLVAWLEAGGIRHERPWARAVGARGRAALLAARGDLAAAIEAADGAMAQHDRVAMPFERARTLLVKGQIHRRRKEKRLADQALRAALGIFEGLDASSWAARTRIELGRIGLRPRASNGLSETESRIAELAASGLTNREVALAAFLSAKTVENVLGRVYSKLGIRSRAELGAVMAARSPGGPGEPIVDRAIATADRRDRSG